MYCVVSDDVPGRRAKSPPMILILVACFTSTVELMIGQIFQSSGTATAAARPPGIYYLV